MQKWGVTPSHPSEPRVQIPPDRPSLKSMQGHDRPLPKGTTVARILRQLFARMREDVRLRPGRRERIELGKWLPVMAEVLEPALLPIWGRGIKESHDHLRSLHQRTRGRGPSHGGHKSLGHVIRKDLPGRPTIALDLDLFNPRILEAVRREIFTFCQTTLDTLQLDVNRGLQLFRSELGESLQEGESYHSLNARMMELFNDSYRASRAAQTEAVRAVHGGQFLADKESGIVEAKQWLCSADACELCRSLAEKGAIPLDEPFWVNPKGGPYAVIMYPGAHPFCMCTYLSLTQPGSAAGAGRGARAGRGLAAREE